MIQLEEKVDLAVQEHINNNNKYKIIVLKTEV